MSVDLRLKVSQWGRLQLLCGWYGVWCIVYVCGRYRVCLFELWFVCVCVLSFFFSQSDRVFKLDRMKPDPITIWSGWQYCIRSDIAFNSIRSEPDFFFLSGWIFCLPLMKRIWLFYHQWYVTLKDSLTHGKWKYSIYVVK